jgi:hypothetical protein
MRPAWVWTAFASLALAGLIAAWISASTRPPDPKTSPNRPLGPLPAEVREAPPEVRVREVLDAQEAAEAAELGAGEALRRRRLREQLLEQRMEDR